MKYSFNIAMSIRAYGTVIVDGASPEEAKAKINAEFVADNFEPHGGGDDDLDYAHPSDIFCDGGCVDEEGQDCDIEGFEIANGSWIIDA